MSQVQSSNQQLILPSTCCLFPFHQWHLEPKHNKKKHYNHLGYIKLPLMDTMTKINMQSNNLPNVLHKWATVNRMKTNIPPKTNLLLHLNGKPLPAVQAATSLFGYSARSDVVCLQVTEADGVFWHVTRPIYHSDILVADSWWDGSRKCSSGRQSERRRVDEYHCCHQGVTCLACCFASNSVSDLDICPVSSILQMAFVYPFLSLLSLPSKFKTWVQA